MKTLFSIILITVLALGVLMVLGTSNAEAWYRGPFVNFSVAVPPFGLSIGAPGPYYYPGYVAPPYPFYGRPYYRPYYGGYGPYFGHRYWYRGGWRDWDDRGHGHWGHGGWRGDRDGRGHGHWRR